MTRCEQRMCREEDEACSDAEDRAPDDVRNDGQLRATWRRCPSPSRSSALSHSRRAQNGCIDRRVARTRVNGAVRKRATNGACTTRAKKVSASESCVAALAPASGDRSRMAPGTERGRQVRAEAARTRAQREPVPGTTMARPPAPRLQLGTRRRLVRRGKPTRSPCVQAY